MRELTHDQMYSKKPKYGHPELREFLNNLHVELADKGCWNKDEWKVMHWVTQKLVRWPGKQP